MKKKINKDDNFLDLVPKIKSSQQWDVMDEGLIRIIIPRNGVLDKVVRIFFKTPEVMKIDLDSLGSSVWKAIDGNRNIEEIAQIINKEYGEKANPIYQRLVTYINILRNNKFITLEKVSD